MSTYLIHVKLQSAEKEAWQLLETSMQNENFIAFSTDSIGVKSFSYYGNQDLLHINNAVKRAAGATGKAFSYTVMKDKRSEKQYHSH